MNYLDLLPDDVTKIINRKVHDLQIKNRKIERKENQRKMIEQKRIADNKKRIYNKFVRLYEQYVLNQKWEYCNDLVAMMKKEFGSDYLKSDIFLEDEPYIISSVMHDGNYYEIKVSK
jgi:hypothetical protein